MQIMYQVEMTLSNTDRAKHTVGKTFGKSVKHGEGSKHCIDKSIAESASVGSILENNGEKLRLNSGQSSSSQRNSNTQGGSSSSSQSQGSSSTGSNTKTGSNSGSFSTSLTNHLKVTNGWSEERRKLRAFEKIKEHIAKVDTEAETGKILKIFAKVKAAASYQHKNSKRKFEEDESTDKFFGSTTREQTGTNTGSGSVTNTDSNTSAITNTDGSSSTDTNSHASSQETSSSQTNGFENSAKNGWRSESSKSKDKKESIATETCANENTETGTTDKTDQSRSEGKDETVTFTLPQDKDATQNSKYILQKSQTITASKESLVVRGGLIEIKVFCN